VPTVVPTELPADSPSSAPTSAPSRFPTDSPTTTPSPHSAPVSTPAPARGDDDPEPKTKCFNTDNELLAAVDSYLQDPTGALTAKQYGHPIGSWCVDKIQDFAQVFYTERNSRAENFNEDISGWNMSNAKTVSAMFLGASKFNQDISSWDTSSVTDMMWLFYEAKSFDQPLSSWNTASVTNMYGMFLGATRFNQPLSDWDVSSVYNMENMFTDATSFNQSLCAWAEQLPPTCNLTDMFGGANACPDWTATPSLSSVPMGPFCHSCN
jgi:surface protein